MLTFLNDTFWFAMGVAATLVAPLINHRIGRIQISWMRKAHDLNVRKATPKINSRVTLDHATLPHRPDITRYTIHTKIYNDGDLVARELKGQWKLMASHGITEATKPIRAESLPTFLPLELEHEVSGKVPSLWVEPQVVLKVDIDLTYIGMDNREESYHATYEYDFKNRSMVQIG